MHQRRVHVVLAAVFVLGSQTPTNDAASPHDAALAFPRRPTPRRNKRQLRNRGPSGRSNDLGSASGAASLFTVNKVLPPLDVTEMPALSSSASNQNSTTLAGPYGATQYEATPSLRQRDDPYDESCIPHVCGPLPVTYTNSPTIVENWLADNVPSGPTFLGFDVESVPDAPWVRHRALFKGPATVQLSTPDACLVVHLTRNRGERQSTACPAIAALLSDEKVIKVCTGVDDDMLELYRWNRRLQAKSRFDLGGVGSGRSSKERIGLKRLVRAVLGVEMRKSKKLATSNWSRSPLTFHQLAYSARDAWAGAAVMYDLAERHPAIFGPEAVLDLVRDERPIQELHERAARRKKARMQLKEIRYQFKQYSDLTFNEKKWTKGTMPPLVVEEIDRLQGILQETSPDGLIGFDAEPLGLSFTCD